MFRKILLIQIVISIIAFGLDIYGCINLTFPPAIFSVSVGILDLLTLFWFLRKGKKG